MMIFLVGMPGSGKSYWSRKLSRLLHWRAVDLDKAIENASGKTVSQLFEEGEDNFRQWEQKTLKAVIEEHEGIDCIVSTGGGTLCFHDNRTTMQKHGVLIYLKGDSSFVFQRIKQSKTPRPLLEAKGEQELFEKIDRLLRERERFYSKADLTVDAKSLTLPIFTDIIKHFKHDRS